MELWNSVPGKVERKTRRGTRGVEGRADKKKKVSPWVSRETQRDVHDVARYLTRTEGTCPDGEAARRLILVAAMDVVTLGRLAPYYWRDLRLNQTAWLGHRNHRNLDDLLDPYEERLHIRFSQDEWTWLDDIGFALGRDVAPTAAALLLQSIGDERLLQQSAPGFVSRSPWSLKEGTYQWR